VINGRYTLDEAAALLAGPAPDARERRRRHAALWYAVRKGALPAVKAYPRPRSPWLVRPDDLDAYARAHPPARRPTGPPDGAAR